jgi:hypothetical protein
MPSGSFRRVTSTLFPRASGSARRRIRPTGSSISSHPRASSSLRPTTPSSLRVAFAPILEPGEEPASPTTLQGLPVEGFPTNLLLRLGFAFPPDLISEDGDSISVRMSRSDLEQGRCQAWVLLTNRGVWWHFTGDGAPQDHPGLEPELGGGLRFLPTRTCAAGPSITRSPFQCRASQSTWNLFVFDVGGYLYRFAVSGAYQPENLRWHEFLRRRET